MRGVREAPRATETGAQCGVRGGAAAAQARARAHRGFQASGSIQRVTGARSSPAAERTAATQRSAASAAVRSAGRMARRQPRCVTCAQAGASRRRSCPAARASRRRVAARRVRARQSRTAARSGRAGRRQGQRPRPTEQQGSRVRQRTRERRGVDRTGANALPRAPLYTIRARRRACAARSCWPLAAVRTSPSRRAAARQP